MKSSQAVRQGRGVYIAPVFSNIPSSTPVLWHREKDRGGLRNDSLDMGGSHGNVRSWQGRRVSPDQGRVSSVGSSDDAAGGL